MEVEAGLAVKSTDGMVRRRSVSRRGEYVHRAALSSNRRSATDRPSRKQTAKPQAPSDGISIWQTLARFVRSLLGSGHASSTTPIESAQ
jgi:hypothetical protein